MVNIWQDLTSLTDEQLQQLLAESAKEALIVQDACNLSGVVFTWAKVMNIVCEVGHRHGHDTAWRNGHPINVLFADKVASLAGLMDTSEHINRFYRACVGCRELAKEIL